MSEYGRVSNNLGEALIFSAQLASCRKVLDESEKRIAAVALSAAQDAFPFAKSELTN